MPFEPLDFKVGLDIGICGRSIRIYDCDQYTREFFDVSTHDMVILFDLIKCHFYILNFVTVE